MSDGGADEGSSLLNEEGYCRNCWPLSVYTVFFCAHVTSYVLFALGAIYEKRGIWDLNVIVVVLAGGCLCFKFISIIKGPCKRHFSTVTFPVLFSILELVFAGTVIRENKDYNDLNDVQKARQASILQAFSGQASQILLAICVASAVLLWRPLRAGKETKKTETSLLMMTRFCLFATHMIAYLIFSVGASYEREDPWRSALIVTVFAIFSLLLSGCTARAGKMPAELQPFSVLFLLLEIAFGSLIWSEAQGYSNLTEAQQARQAQILQNASHQASQMALVFWFATELMFRHLTKPPPSTEDAA